MSELADAAGYEIGNDESQVEHVRRVFKVELPAEPPPAARADGEAAQQ